MELNLLSGPKLIKKWLPHFSNFPGTWKIYSGNWEIAPSGVIRCQGKTRIRTGENIALCGSRQWSNYPLTLTFKILSKSIRPPEGGVVFYYHFKNFRNYYSLHFCHAKNKIELIKRVRGMWSTIVNEKFHFETHKDYQIVFGIIDNAHYCEINGKNVYTIQDTDVINGQVGIGTKFCSAEFSRITISVKESSKN